MGLADHGLNGLDSLAWVAMGCHENVIGPDEVVRTMACLHAPCEVGVLPVGWDPWDWAIYKSGIVKQAHDRAGPSN